MKKPNRSFKDLSQLVLTLLILPGGVAHTILNVANSPNQELRNPVGKDAKSIFKARNELSDRELEQWARESYMEKKGFVRQ